MEIEEIIFSNNLLLYDKYALNIKRFILEILVTQDLILDKYQDCINYFILKRDKNFLDSLYNKNICSILYKGLNDPYMVNLFDSNQIIISKSIHLFNREMNWSNWCTNANTNANPKRGYTNDNTKGEYTNVNTKGVYTNLNINYNLNIYEIKNELLQLDTNIHESLKKLNNIYNKLFSNNNNLFTKMYNKINDIIDINKLELETRKKEITILIETIYKLVLGEKKTIIEINNETFINAVRIISIIYLKVDKLLNDKKIDTVDDLFNENKLYLNEILDVFNNKKDSKDTIIHIKNIIITYNKIKEILRINENIVERIEELLDEFKGLSKININNIDPYIHSFINDIKESILVLEKCDDESNLIKELNTSIIKLFNDILDDNNIQVYYTRYDEVEGCEKDEGSEKEYLQNQINIIEDVLDTSIFDSLNIKWYTYLNMTQITKKLEDIIPLQNSLNEDIKRLEIRIAETETENEDFENIRILNNDLIKKIENNKKLIDEYKSVLEM